MSRPEVRGFSSTPQSIFPLAEGRTLYPHQQNALQWAEDKNFVAFFMQMRLGKTITAIRWAQAKNPAKVLVVCPAPVVFVWPEELRAEGLPAMALVGTKRREMVAEGWNIISYDSLRGSPEIARQMWDVVILDESTRIRVPRSKISKLITTELAKFAQCRAILSGLPAPESVHDYFQQILFLREEFMGCTNYWQWRNRYFQPDAKGWTWYPKPGTERRVTNALREMSFTIHRKDVNLGGRKIRERRVIPMSIPQRKMHQQALKEWAAADHTTRNALTKVLWMARAAGGFDPDGRLISTNKLRELDNLLMTELAKEQVIVWFRFRAELREALRRIAGNGIPVAAIHGDIIGRARRDILSKFASGKIRVLLAQVQTLKEGVNLASADTAIYYSNEYEHGIRAQSEDRIISMNKNTPALLIDLVSDNSIDEGILQILLDKRIQSSKILEELKQWAVTKCK